jgi:hypothetical protein
MFRHRLAQQIGDFADSAFGLKMIAHPLIAGRTKAFALGRDGNQPLQGRG